MKSLKRFLNQDVYIGVFFLLLAGVLFYLTSNLIAEAAIFPYILIALLVLFTFFIIKTGVGRKEFESHGDDEEKLNKSLLKTPLVTFLGVFLYCLFITLIGFFPSTVIFIVAYLYINNYRSVKYIIITVVSVSLFVYLVFVYQLNVRLPIGIFFE